MPNLEKEKNNLKMMESKLRLSEILKSLYLPYTLGRFLDEEAIRAKITRLPYLL